MIEYYEQLTQEEQERVGESIRTLYRQTFILEKKYDKRTGRSRLNPEYYQCTGHLEFIRAYFSIMGIDVIENTSVGVIYIRGEQVVGEKLPKLATLYILVLKLICDEQMMAASTTENAVTSLGAVHEKLAVYRLLKRQPSPTEIKRSLSLLKRYQMIELLDPLEDLEGPVQMVIYPAIQVVLMGDDARELIGTYGEGDIQEDEDSDESNDTRRIRALRPSHGSALNNWHYIRHRVLTFHEGVNFFHRPLREAASPRSLTPCRSCSTPTRTGGDFSIRRRRMTRISSLIEYLRGMVNIGEDEKFSYLRSQNFSSTIVLELTRTDTGECQCVGVVFDVETATNEITRMFFWHKGPLPASCLPPRCRPGRTMSTEEVKAWLLENFTKETCYFGSHNETVPQASLRLLSGRAWIRRSSPCFSGAPFPSG